MPFKVLQNAFKAWVNAMPGSKPHLIVVGECEAPSTGWKAELLRATPQGINPKILILDLVATSPEAGGGAITPLKVRYEEPAQPGQFTDVTIRHERQSFTIPVTTAS